MLRRLILIDRDRARKDSLEGILNSEFDLKCYQSLDQVIEEIEDHPPLGIIVIDDKQPEDILRSLRSLEASRELPMIVVSDSSSPTQEMAAFQAGADEFITKESDPEVLRTRVLGILHQAYVVRRLETKLGEMDFFLRAVSHDLKNPLGSILSCAELLNLALNTGDLEEARELTGHIQNSSEQALEFVQDLLCLLRNGTQLREVVEVPVQELIADAIKELEVKIKVSGATIEVPPRLPPILCDKRRMIQVFTNVIGNAIKYVAKGVKPQIVINSIETPHANTFVITDNGIGMQTGDTKKIFQAFVRLKDADDYEGTGLGLSIVHRIIEAHEGEVFATSRKGKGSEFYIVIPTQLTFSHQLEGLFLPPPILREDSGWRFYVAFQRGCLDQPCCELATPRSRLLPAGVAHLHWHVQAPEFPCELPHLSRGGGPEYTVGRVERMQNTSPVQLHLEPVCAGTGGFRGKIYPEGMKEAVPC